jgi:hypothetical protein
MTDFSHIYITLITYNHYIKLMYEVTMSILTKMKFKLVLINNATFVGCQNGHS